MVFSAFVYFAVYAYAHVGRKVRTHNGNQFFSTLWVPGIKFRSSRLVASLYPPHCLASPLMCVFIREVKDQCWVVAEEF